jgi:hypothetical protein
LQGEVGAFPRVLVAEHEGLACLIEPRQITMLQLPGLARTGEVGVEEGSSVCLVGTPPRLLVLVPNGTLHVVDPEGVDGPQQLAEMTVAPGSRFLAVSGSYALVATSGGIVLVNVEDPPQFSRFPTRSGEVEIASAIKPDHFLVQVGGVLEEWSGPTRSPQRRFRLDRALSALYLGAGARFIWYIARDTPDQLNIVPLVGTAPPSRVDLPEPASLAVGDPSGLQVAVIGDRSRALWVVSLATRTLAQVMAVPTDTVGWRGTHDLVRVTESVVEIVSVPKTASATNAEAAWTRTTTVPLRPAATERPPATTAQQLAAWKQKVTSAREPAADAVPTPARTPATGPVATTDPARTPLETVIAVYQWRDALAAWARASLRGTHGDPPLLAACTLHDVCQRLGLVDDTRFMVWLIYGARLCGIEGVAPVELVELCPNRWDDALGRTRVASLGVFSWKRDRVHLMPEIKNALDEIDPVLGTIVSSGSVLGRRLAVVAPAGTDYVALARAVAPEVGSLFAPGDRGVHQPERFLLEARVRGLVPVIQASWFEGRSLPNIAALIVVDDEATARRLELPIVPAVAVS